MCFYRFFLLVEYLCVDRSTNQNWLLPLQYCFFKNETEKLSSESGGNFLSIIDVIAKNNYYPMKELKSIGEVVVANNREDVQRK